jgi:hypothetical protein
MRYEEVVERLAWAGNQERAVRVLLADGRELLGVPTSLDTHITVHEAWLRPLDADTDVAVSLGEIRAVELL